jgi:carboxypeptidase C (cathepsin A)
MMTPMPHSRPRAHAALSLLLALNAVAAVEPLNAQQLPTAQQYPPVVTHHQGVFNAKKVAYTATVRETLVRNAAGIAAARIVSTAYTADGADPATRPVLFACNGGPIGPSNPLHMLAIGPRRLAIPADLKADPSTFQVVDNTYTVLDVADIVFFDPASTGWSRVLEGIKPEEYYTVDADAQQFAAFIEQWLRDNNRMASPKYLLGESYATIRVPETAKQLLRLSEPIALDGVFLMGQAANQLEVNTRPYNIIAPVIGLPSVAATAWYHNKVDRKGRTVDQVVKEAMDFGVNDYLQALFKGYNALDDATRNRIASRLEYFTAIPASYFLANNLRITRPTFQNELFKKEGLKLGSDDARYIGPVSGPEPDAGPAGASYRALMQYFKDELKVERADEYRQRQFPPSDAGGRRGGAGGRGGGGGGGWAYAGTASPFSDFPYTSSVTDLLNKNPKARVYVGSGIYDMKTTTGAAEYLIAQSGWPKDRVRISYYEGGHMAYTNESALKKFTDDIRLMVTGR